MQSETLAQEFARLVAEYRADTNGPTGAEAWNLIADFAVENAAAISSALSIEQTQPVQVKALEWRREAPYHVARVFGGLYAVEAWDGGVTLSGIPGRRDFKDIEAAKAAAQQDYETRIRSAIVGVAGTSIPADLVERCSEIFGWKESGILTGDKLRGQARAIRENFNCVFDAGEALRQAEEETKREAMRFIIALSTTRIADSAEAGGSATLSIGGDHGA